ncbi:hypothetical protein EIN_217870 [Entamoeba invadens IP1]|uniref:Uncharacterized protein n=1 Tax=Entamoeba invadens IP1 TaxID=370355 RepID=L7FP10_ENTIV|nr:hypothetical protein EIN_217870 [Entamoeba invadens IP1]ELP95322.1 hypothetical protein EIN_217870 [Entamoeba invadens IP1]|eukprot:XP_004262093.1 hypothetical protein EIN_217870 [Entamoeba invadens IP1]
MYETRNKIIKKILDEFFNTRDLPLPKEFDCTSSPFRNIFIDKKVAILSQTKAERTIDLNKDLSVYIVNELLRKLEPLCTHVLKLLEEFPENEVLVKIISIIERLKNFPKDRPSHEIFDSPPYLAWFVNVWKMVDEMVNNEVDEQIELGFLESMNQFMYKCTYGQFEERLKVLGIVIQICQVMLTQTWEYYNVFVSRIKEDIDRETKPVETKIKEFVKLIIWNDINHKKIKDQVEKSNRKLYGFKKEYDDILKKNVQFFVQSQTFANTTSATDKALGPIFKEIHKSEKIIKTVDSKKRTDNIGYFIYRIAVLKENTIRVCVEEKMSKEKLGVVWLEEVKKELIGRVVEFQNLTGNEGVKTKKRALLDILLYFNFC